MKIGQKGISKVAIVVIAVAVVVVVGAVSAIILLKPREGPAPGSPTTPTTTEEGYLGDVEPYVKQEGLTAVWGYWYITVYRTIGNSGEAGVVTVTCQSNQVTQTKYIYLDKGKEKQISFQISDGWHSEPPYVTPYYNVTASPTPAVYIQGKPGQDYIPELSNIEIVADVSEGGGVKVDVLFSDDKGRILAFEGIPMDVTVKVYTEKDMQIYEKTVTIDSYKDASSRLGGEKIEVPFDVYDLKEVGFVEVIVHTSKGDFKDEVRV